MHFSIQQVKYRHPIAGILDAVGLWGGVLILLLAVAAASYAAQPESQGQHVLLGELRFGMDKQAMLALPGAKDGGQDFPGEIILPGVEFAGLPWTARLEFAKPRPNITNSGQAEKGDAAEWLVRICLAEIYSKKRLDAVNQQLRSDGFEQLGMLAQGKKLDFISILKISGPEELQRQISELYRRDDLSLVSSAWFDTSKISREMKFTARNLNELLHLVAADTREAEVTLTGDKGKIQHIQVIFSLPVLEIQAIGSQG